MKIAKSGFFSISGHQDELEIANSENIFLIKYFRSLQNVMITALTIFKLLTENQPWCKIIRAKGRLRLINFS